MLKDILILIFSISVLIVSIYGAYLKLFEKESWLYKESEGIHWLYDTDGIRTWAIILSGIIAGIGGIFGILRKILWVF